MKILIHFFHLLFKLFTIKKKKIIIFYPFDSAEKGMYEMPILEEVHKRYAKTHDIFWLSKVKPNTSLDGVVFLKENSISHAYKLAKAEYFISGTFSKNPFLSKKTKVFYINHGYIVKTMGIDWVNSSVGIRRVIRNFAHKNQVKQIDICFVHDEFDKKVYSRSFAHKGKKNTEFIINGFPVSDNYKKGDSLLFLPSWHEEQKISFPKTNIKNKYVSFHPRTLEKEAPEGWVVVDSKERQSLKLKYILSDNSSAPLEYIKSEIQAYWIKGKYDRDFCVEFYQEYEKLLIDVEEFKPLSDTKYKIVVSNILEAPVNESSINITVDAMNIK